MKDVKYLDRTQAAAYLGLSRRTLIRYRVSGDGPMYLRFGNRVRYVREDLDEWAHSDRRSSKSDDGGKAVQGALLAVFVAIAVVGGRRASRCLAPGGTR